MRLHREVSVATALTEGAAYPAVQGWQIAYDLYQVLVGGTEGEVAGVVGITRVFEDSLGRDWRFRLGTLMAVAVHLSLFWLLLDLLVAVGATLYRRREAAV